MTRLIALLLLAARLSAVTTETFTPTASPSATPTVTPGEGNWSYALPTPLVYGEAGYYGTVAYQAGSTAWPSGGGALRFVFPAGFSVNGSNFYVQPTQSNKLLAPPSYSGQQVDLQVKDLAASDTLTFFYGYSPGGFAVNTTVSPMVLQVWAYPQSISLGAGGGVAPAPAQTLAPVMTATATPTASPTPSITLTSTPSPDWSATPTFTPTQTPDWTMTVTPTFTPIGPERSGVYCYPNPFDRRIHQLVTFRFPTAPVVDVKVYRLNGDPVAKVGDADIDASQGWGRWRGDDDLGRPCPGGLYFVRVKTPNGTYVKKFILFN